MSYLSRYVSRRSLLTQLTIATVAIALVVGSLAVGLPTREIEAKAPTPYDPPSPTVVKTYAAGKLGVDAPFVLRFTKPMNGGSVADALVVKPATAVRLVWDSTGEALSITPATYWAPFTTYSVTVAGTAMDQSGMQLGSSLSANFSTGALTSGKIAATAMVGTNVAPTSAFTITFSRPVKLATIQARLSVTPTVTGTITGDDPTDASSQVFTFTPDDILAGGTTFVISFDATNATDASGVALLPVDPLTVTTLAAPEIVRFRPLDGHSTADPNQVISVRFSVPMSHTSTAAAFSVVVGGKRVRGSVSWAENNTVLVFDPSSRLPVGSTVYVRISSTARSIAGQRLSKAYAASFRVVKPTVTRLVYRGVRPLANAPWHGAELYMLQLINCTRTGGWVTSGGSCSSVTHHVMPAQDALRYDSGIATKVSRPYAKALADRGALTHYLYGTPKSRLAAAGYGGGSWGENITMPSSSGAGGMIQSEIFFQNEYRCKSGRCEFGHYYNVMDPYFSRAGVGVWVTRGHTRVVIDFYG
jgi:hypothetical protein